MAAEREALRRGWCLGGAGFRGTDAAVAGGGEREIKRRKAVDGAVRQSHDLDEAERLLEAGLKEMALDRAALAELKRSDRRKTPGPGSSEAGLRCRTNGLRAN